MPGWTSATASSVTWAGAGVTGQTFTRPTVGVTVWGLPRPRPEPGTDAPALDFEFQFRDTGYGVFSDDRPLLFLSSLSEGQP